MDLNDQPVRYVLPDGFTDEDLLNPAYSAPLSAAAAPMAAQARQLCEDMDETGFCPSTAFDVAFNGAYALLDDFFNTLVGFAQGRVPVHATDALVAETTRLVEKQAVRYHAICAAQVHAVRQAFTASFVFWSRRGPLPTLPRAVYVKRLFEGKERIIDAVSDFACALAVHDVPYCGGVAGKSVSPPPKRKRRGLTQAQIAAAFGVSRKEVGRWENGSVPPPAGYTRELRKSGDLAAMAVVQSRYRKVRRDVYAAKRVVHNLPV